MQLLDVQRSALDAAVAEINSRSGVAQSCAGHVCDVSDAESVEAVFAAIAASGKRIDILINNAGISAVGDVLSCDDAQLERVWSVNVKGVFHCLKTGVKHMLADGKGGSIVNLASIASIIGLNDRFSYAATKGAEPLREKRPSTNPLHLLFRSA